MAYRTYRLSDLASIKYGKDQKRVQDDANGSVPILGTGGIMGYALRPLYEKPSVLIGRKGSINKVRYIDTPFWTVDTLFYTVINEALVRPRYLYYLMSVMDMTWYNEGTTVPSLRTDMLNRIEFSVPDLHTQDRVLSVLLHLDGKLELNARLAQTLEEQAQTLFQLKFSDFSSYAPDALTDSELGAIPCGWRVAELGEFFPVVTGKVNANIARPGGPYAFFTCSQDISRADRCSFDGSAVLLAGNGDFNVKFYTGKFEAYQRTYVLMPYQTKLLGFLYYTLKSNLAAITAGFRGSVVRFITKGDIAHFKIAVPPFLQENRECVALQQSLEMINSLREESAALEKHRDTLLPGLLTGEIEVPPAG